MSGFGTAAARDKAWEELHEQFGSGQKVAASLRKKVEAMAKIREDAKLGERLQELRRHCHALAINQPYVPALTLLNFSVGQEPIWRKLPERFSNRWIREGARYAKTNGGHHPPFQLFLKFVEDLVVECSNDDFQLHKPGVSVLATSMEEPSSDDSGAESGLPCPLHLKASHPLRACTTFSRLPVETRRTVARDEGRCFQCLGPHLRSDCSEEESCRHCGFPGHHHLLCLSRDSRRRRNQRRRPAKPWRNGAGKKTTEDEEGSEGEDHNFRGPEISST